MPHALMMADTSKHGNSGRVEIDSSVTDSLHSVHGVVYVIFYRRIRIPRIFGNFGTCTDSVYQLGSPFPHKREPGFKANIRTQFADSSYMTLIGVHKMHGRVHPN